MILDAPYQPRSGTRIASLLAGAMAVSALVAACQSTPKAKTALIQAPASCDDMTISLYFEPRSAAITHAAGAVLDAAAATARRCVVRGIDVKGLADTVGAPDANMALSKERANAVTLALDHRGFTTVPINVAAVGDVGAQTTSGEARPLRRRANVTFHLAPKT